MKSERQGALWEPSGILLLLHSVLPRTQSRLAPTQAFVTSYVLRPGVIKKPDTSQPPREVGVVLMPLLLCSASSTCARVL